MEIMSLTKRQAEIITDICGFPYHYHDDEPKMLSGYEQPYIHIYSYRYDLYTIRIGCFDGNVIFSSEEGEAAEIRNLSEEISKSILQKTPSSINSQNNLKKIRSERIKFEYDRTNIISFLKNEFHYDNNMLVY